MERFGQYRIRTGVFLRTIVRMLKWLEDISRGVVSEFHWVVYQIVGPGLGRIEALKLCPLGKLVLGGAVGIWQQ